MKGLWTCNFPGLIPCGVIPIASQRRRTVKRSCRTPSNTVCRSDSLDDLFIGYLFGRVSNRFSSIAPRWRPGFSRDREDKRGLIERSSESPWRRALHLVVSRPPQTAFVRLELARAKVYAAAAKRSQ